MLAASNCVERKKEEINPLNLALIVEVNESSTIIDVDEIIISKNITDLCTLKIYMILLYQKNMKMDSFVSNVQSSQKF
jgi:hypothetical protein